LAVYPFIKLQRIILTQENFQYCYLWVSGLTVNSRMMHCYLWVSANYASLINFLQQLAQRWQPSDGARSVLLWTILATPICPCSTVKAGHAVHLRETKISDLQLYFTVNAH